MGIYPDYSKIRGIRMLKSETFNDNKYYYYHTRKDKILTKEDILKAKDFYDASQDKFIAEIYVEISKTYDVGVEPTYMWIKIESINIIV